VTGFALSHEDELLHLSAFKCQNDDNNGRTASMGRFSSRRRNRG
jgi:hypothetical protein